MGKGSRIKKERAEDKGSNDQDAAGLLVATEVVGLLFGTEPDCAGAAGMLYAIGEELGFSLRALPVSVIAREKATNTLLTMGPKASNRFDDDQLARMENHRPGGKDNGHIILLSDDHKLLLDPNMRQLCSFGVEAPSVAMRLKNSAPDSGEWVFSSETLEILYLVDEENRALIPRFENCRREARPYAQIAAKGIRNGIPAIVIAGQIRPSIGDS